MARPRRSMAALAAFGLVGLGGCAANGVAGAEPDSRQEVGAGAALPPTASALVLGPDELRREGGMSVLDAMEAELPAVHVSQTVECPTLTLSGPGPLPGAPQPTIYLDGSRSIDTCILRDLTVDEVARVEVYPAGFTPRPGYAGNPGGLILLFTRQAGAERGAAAGIRH